MPASLPAEVLELILRGCEDAAQDDDALGTAAALDRRRFLRGAALVARWWQPAAVRLLAETVVIARSTDLYALDTALGRGHVRSDWIRTLIVDDTAVELDEAEEEAWSRYEDSPDALQRSRDRGDRRAERRMQRFLPGSEDDVLAWFAQALWRLVERIHPSAMKFAFARTLAYPHCELDLRTIVIASNEARWFEEEDQASWPNLPASVTDLRIDDVGADQCRMPPLPGALTRVRQLRLGARNRSIGFKTCLWPAPANGLVSLDVVLEHVITADPRALFRVDSTDVVSTPNLRRVRIGITPTGLEALDQAELLAHLPSSVIVLEFVVYTAESRGGELEIGAAPAFADAIVGTLGDLPPTSELRRITLNVGDLCESVAGALRGQEVTRSLVAACEARGIGFAVDEADSGMF